jgi:hypothetical protein
LTTKCFCNEDGLSQADFLRRVSGGETFYTHSEFEKDTVVSWLDNLDPKSHNGVVVAGNTPWYVYLMDPKPKTFSCSEFQVGSFYCESPTPKKKQSIFIRTNLKKYDCPIFIDVKTGRQWLLTELNRYYELTPTWSLKK